MLNYHDLHQLGLYFGRVALTLYFLTLLPGICRRLKIKGRIVAFLTLYRRQVGITMYAFAALHTLFLASPLFKVPTYKLFGILAFLALTPLFLTSNDYAVKKLKQNWKRVHKLTYLALGLLFLHTAVVKISIFSAAAFVVLMVLIISFIVDGLNKQTP